MFDGLVDGVIGNVLGGQLGPQNAFGPQVVQQLAQQGGMNPQDLMQQLSTILPGFVDKLTPGGVIPKG